MENNGHCVCTNQISPVESVVSRGAMCSGTLVGKNALAKANNITFFTSLCAWYIETFYCFLSWKLEKTKKKSERSGKISGQNRDW